jgi:hypothetical protein
LHLYLYADQVFLLRHAKALQVKTKSDTPGQTFTVHR